MANSYFAENQLPPTPQAPEPQYPQFQAPAPEGGGNGNGRRTKLIIAAAVAVLLLFITALLLFYRGDDNAGLVSKTGGTGQQSPKNGADADRGAAGQEDETPAEERAGTSGVAPNDPGQCDATITQSQKNAIAAAVQTRNFSNLAPYLAEEVAVVIDAIEQTGPKHGAAAIDHMRYLNGTTDPWDFSLPRGVTDVWAVHEYGSYFKGEFYAGRAASEEVVSFQFDACGDIKRIFMISDYHKLES